MENKIIDNTDEITKKFREGIQRLLFIEKEIKDLKEEMKTIKKDIKENGVDMKLFNKTYSILKKLKKEEKQNSDPLYKQAFEEAVECKKDENIETLLDDLYEKD